MVGPRRVVSFEDEHGQRTITVNMAYGLSVKLSVTQTGETVLYVDRESTEGESASSTHIAIANAEGHTTVQTHPRTKPADGPTNELPKRGRGRPRMHPIAPPMPPTFGDFKEGLEMAHR